MDMRKVAREVRLSKWAEIIREQKISGQSIHAWCAANGITKQQYFYWQRQLREIACEGLVVQSERLPQPALTFTEVITPAEASPTGSITVRMGEAVVEIVGDVSPATVESILQALMKQC